MIDFIATLVAIVGLVSGGAGAAYLFLLQSAAKKKGASGQPVLDDVRKRRAAVAVALALGLVALLLTSGGTGADIVAMIVGAGAIGAGTNALTQARKKYQL